MLIWKVQQILPIPKYISGGRKIFIFKKLSKQLAPQRPLQKEESRRFKVITVRILP